MDNIKASHEPIYIKYTSDVIFYIYVYLLYTKYSLSVWALAALEPVTVTNQENGGKLAGIKRIFAHFESFWTILRSYYDKLRDYSFTLWWREGRNCVLVTMVTVKMLFQSWFKANVLLIPGYIHVKQKQAKLQCLDFQHMKSFPC